MENEIKKWLKGKGEGFLRDVGIKEGQTVLDFGCRTGNYTIPAAQIVGKKGKLYALDKDKESLDKLTKRAKKKGLDNIEIIKTSGELKIPLRKESTDVVLLYDIIHLVGQNNSSTVNDRKKLYQAIYRITKKNALVSVYPTHLKTHTDVSSIKEIKKESEEFFKFKRELLANLIHDDDLVKGHILNFRK